MNIVEPIKSMEKIQEMKQILAKKPRNALLFSFGINSGLRIADILSLDVKDVKDKDYIELREKKTNKYKKFKINENLKAELEEFIKDKPDNLPLFYTQKHCRLDRAQAYRIINKAARMVGIKARIGTHTLRKTFGYRFYQQYDDIVMLQKFFNISYTSIRLRYIGIEREDIDAEVRDFICN
jgi:integrase